MKAGMKEMGIRRRKGGKNFKEKLREGRRESFKKEENERGGVEGRKEADGHKRKGGREWFKKGGEIKEGAWGRGKEGDGNKREEKNFLKKEKLKEEGWM